MPLQTTAHTSEFALARPHRFTGELKKTKKSTSNVQSGRQHDEAKSTNWKHMHIMVVVSVREGVVVSVREFSAKAIRYTRADGKKEGS
jgi:hypothetical protein